MGVFVGVTGRKEEVEKATVPLFVYRDGWIRLPAFQFYSGARHTLLPALLSYQTNHYKLLRPARRPTHSAGAIISNVTNLARSRDQFNKAGERHKRLPARTTCGKAFIRATVFGGTMDEQKIFSAHFPEGKLFPLSETTFLDPEPRSRAPTRRGIWVRGKILMAEDFSFIGSQPKVEDAGDWGTSVCPREGFSPLGQTRKQITCVRRICITHECNHWPG
jgi:hypothetical protein